MNFEKLYEEEEFGVLSTDDLYLDCALIKPKELPDNQLESLYVWVPRYPLTKTTLINCARHDVTAEWRQSKAAHLVFDLRGTGDSDGTLGDKHFDRDLDGIKIWATERFGDINIVFQGQPYGHGTATVFPIRPGVILEYYHYPTEPDGKDGSHHPPLLYISTPGNFNRVDDELCVRLARAGYEVYAMDPLRYLLHASSTKRLKAADQWSDLEIFLNAVPEPPILIGQPLGAGLALLWACGLERTQGVISIGKAQDVFDPWHIFDNNNPHSYFINRHLYRLAPRPAAYIMLENNEMGGDPREIAAFYATTSHPRLADKTKEISPRFLLKILAWMEKEFDLDES
jgi:pimeloyl-ACP methyl ester carboxylesterase